LTLVAALRKPVRGRPDPARARRAGLDVLWLAGPRTDPSLRRRTDAELLAEIAAIHDRSGGTYGSPRVHATLRRRGICVSRKRVERLMREAGLAGAFLRKRWRTGSTRQNPRTTPAPDLVNRDFTAPAPDRLRAADATRITLRTRQDCDGTC
jgi:putative transposase